MTVTLSPKRVAAVLVLALVATVVLLLRPGGSDANALTSAAAASTRSTISGLCKGEQQGPIKGSSVIKGRTGTYEITGIAHGVGVPIDSSGFATGRRQHQPLRFTMTVDRSTTQLLNAELNGENLTSCVFSFYRRSPDGAKEFVYLRFALSDARVVDYAFAGRQGGPDVVSFKLAYRSIEWTYPEGNLTTSDDWNIND